MTDQPMNEPSIVRWDGADVTLLTARIVEPGHEETFQAWARGILAAASSSPGHLGGGLFRPAANGGPWIIVHRFRDQAALNQWLTSPARAVYFDGAEGHHHTEVARRELTGIEAWFTGLDPSNTAPPRWKMAIAAGLGSYPVSLLANGVLAPQLASLTLLVRAAISALLFSMLMTFVLMPLVSRMLKGWLRPTHRGAPITHPFLKRTASISTTMRASPPRARRWAHVRRCGRSRT